MENLPLPEKFIQRLQRIIPDKHWEMVWHSFHVDKPLVLRINSLRSNTEDIINALQQIDINAKTISWKDDALIIDFAQRQVTLESDIYREGLLYSQNLSSQIAPMILNPQPGEEVLDLCAAPGGKTLQMACMMNDEGRIGAVESVKSRFFKLKKNIKSQQANCIDTYLSDGIHIWKKTPERFDRVLVDAPCSSESRFVANQPKTFEHWNEKKIKEVARKQKGLLYSGIQSLKPGGTLVYSTCSFAPEENEAIVAHILNKFDTDIEIVDLKNDRVSQAMLTSLNNPGPDNAGLDVIESGLNEWKGDIFPDEVKNCLRILPNEIMDGFFICKIKKLASTLKSNKMPNKATK